MLYKVVNIYTIFNPLKNVSTTLSVYHNLNLQAISYLRDSSVSALLYIDDRLIGEYNGELQTCLDNTMIRANIAIHLAVKLFISLGYFLNLFKSIQ
jgi:hypothetical protein